MLLTLLIQVSNAGPSVVRNKSVLGRTEREKERGDLLGGALVHLAIITQHGGQRERGTFEFL